MDQTTPREETLAKPLKPARIALAVLALCFVLSMIGRGLGETFTVFLKPISANFGWDRAQVVSVYSLTWLVSGLTAPVVGRLLDRSGPRIVYSLGVFLLGWILQFIGHYFEGEPPEFFKDWRFLFVGLGWWLAKISGKA